MDGHTPSKARLDCEPAWKTEHARSYSEVPQIIEMWPHLFGKKINQEFRLEPADILLELLIKVGFDLADHPGFLVRGKRNITHHQLYLYWEHQRHTCRSSGSTLATTSSPLPNCGHVPTSVKKAFTLVSTNPVTPPKVGDTKQRSAKNQCTGENARKGIVRQPTKGHMQTGMNHQKH